MPIAVKVVGYAKRLFDSPGYCFAFKQGMTVRDIFKLLAGHAGPDFKSAIYDVDNGTMNEDIVVFVNSREIRTLCGMGTVLQDSDVITIMPPMAGG